MPSSHFCEGTEETGKSPSGRGLHLGAPATLKIETQALTASSLANSVGGFAIGDVIDFAGLTGVGAVSRTGDPLTLTTNSGATDSVTLTDAGLSNGQRYVAEGDGGTGAEAGTQVVIATAAPIFTVTSNTDDPTDVTLGNPPTGNLGPSGTLREALNFANANPGTTIQFASGLGKIDLQADLPLVSQSTTIIGATDGSTIIDGASAYRGFLVTGVAATSDGVPPAISVGISDLGIQDVLAKGGAGGAVFVGENATVALTDVGVSKAVAQGGAGGTLASYGTGGDRATGSEAAAARAAVSLLASWRLHRP